MQALVPGRCRVESSSWYLGEEEQGDSFLTLGVKCLSPSNPCAWWRQICQFPFREPCTPRRSFHTRAQTRLQSQGNDHYREWLRISIMRNPDKEAELVLHQQWQADVKSIIAAAVILLQMPPSDFFKGLIRGRKWDDLFQMREDRRGGRAVAIMHERNKRSRPHCVNTNAQYGDAWGFSENMLLIYNNND